jgi:hypothetical protein
MKNFNEQTGELRVNDVLTTTFNEQTGEVKVRETIQSLKRKKTLKLK